MSESSCEMTVENKMALQRDEVQIDEGQNSDSGREKTGAIQTYKKKKKGGKKKNRKPKAAEQDNKPKKEGIVTDSDGDTLCGNSIPEESESGLVSDTDTTPSLPFTSLTLPAHPKTLNLPGCFSNTEHNLVVPATSDTNKQQQSAETNLKTLYVPCTSCSATTAAIRTRIAKLEAEREPLKTDLDEMDDGTTKTNIHRDVPVRRGNNHESSTKKKRRAGRGKKKAGGEAENSKVAQLRGQIRVLDERIAAGEREQQAGELHCKIRRYGVYIHEESARWMAIDHSAADVSVGFQEHVERMAVLRAEVKKFEAGAARLEDGRAREEDASIVETFSRWILDLYMVLRTLLVSPPRKVYNWECPKRTVSERLMGAYMMLSTLWAMPTGNVSEESCPCGQPVSGRLMNLFMVLLILWVLHSWFGY